MVEKTGSPHVLWGLNHRRPAMPAGKILRIQADSPGKLFWHSDTSRNGQAITLRDTGLGMYYADLPTADLPVGSMVRFYFEWPKGKWINKKEWFVTKSDVVRIETAQESEQPAMAASR